MRVAHPCVVNVYARMVAARNLCATGEQLFITTDARAAFAPCYTLSGAHPPNGIYGPSAVVTLPPLHGYLRANIRTCFVFVFFALDYNYNTRCRYPLFL
jgi:hypothetical protein